MAGWCILLSVLFSCVTGSPLEVTSPLGIHLVNVTSLGVDITQCTQLIFRMKSCIVGHILLGDGTELGSYEIVIGMANNTRSALRRCSLRCYDANRIVSSNGILNCDEYRNFWVSWGNGHIALGTGNTPHAGVIFDFAEQLVHDIDVLGLMGYYTSSVSIKLGDDNMSRYELIGRYIKYTGTPLTDTTNKTVCACGLLCHAHSYCGRFSYSHAQTRCVLFDRNPPAFSVASEPGWESWRMVYCNE